MGLNIKKKTETLMINPVFCAKNVSAGVAKAASMTSPKIKAAVTSITPDTTDTNAAILIGQNAPRNAQRKNGMSVFGGGPSADANGLIQFENIMCHAQ
jgi:hypothetical protein